MASNGRLSRRSLAPVGGGERLRKDAAKAYIALDRYLQHQGKGSLQHSGQGSCYRRLGRPGDYRRGGRFTQWYAWERYEAGGNLAARPGTSNHGLGLAVDFSSIDLVKAYGSKFGWQKTEAFSEPWHYCFIPGRYPMVGAWSQVRSGDLIMPGDRGPGVRSLKRELKKHGCWPWKVKGEGYGIPARRAVKRFQREHGLSSDGVVGKQTWAALRRPRRRKKK
jgi:hypothetical protein